MFWRDVSTCLSSFAAATVVVVVSNLAYDRRRRLLSSVNSKDGAELASKNEVFFPVFVVVAVILLYLSEGLGRWILCEEPEMLVLNGLTLSVFSFSFVLAEDELSLILEERKEEDPLLLVCLSISSFVASCVFTTSSMRFWFHSLFILNSSLILSTTEYHRV